MKTRGLSLHVSCKGEVNTHAELVFLARSAKVAECRKQCCSRLKRGSKEYRACALQCVRKVGVPVTKRNCARQCSRFPQGLKKTQGMRERLQAIVFDKFDR